MWSVLLKVLNFVATNPATEQIAEALLNDVLDKLQNHVSSQSSPSK